MRSGFALPLDGRNCSGLHQFLADSNLTPSLPKGFHNMGTWSGVDGAPEAEKRYSPPVCLGAERTVIHGNPDPAHISTSYVERQNLSMRMGIRRFTRLTNAFSKKLENHMHALSIYFMHYNFVRIHQTLRVTPAMEAGVTDRLWDLSDIVRIVDE
jgi:hypothetical protein